MRFPQRAQETAGLVMVIVALILLSGAITRWLIG